MLVSSSNLSAYRQRAKTTIEIRFRKGKNYSYLYEGVPPQIIEELGHTTGSKGAFFDYYIKKGNYKCTPIATEIESEQLIIEGDKDQQPNDS